MSGTAEKLSSALSGGDSRITAEDLPQADSGVLPRSSSLCVGRYVVDDRIAAGGMATVHIGRLRGAAGFSRTVAIKRLLPQFASNPEFESLFVHEARLAARIQHPNVVATLDVVADAGELMLVMEYVPGETLARLMQKVTAKSGRVPQHIVLAIMRDALSGLHAAHEARDRRGEPLDIVHRDISPQNLMVGSDGVTRVLDFGIAKAATSVEVTREGLVRGKAAYMAPEQLFGSQVTRRADVYAMGVVLWEILVGQRLFPGGLRPELTGEGEARVQSPRESGAVIDEALDAAVMRALSVHPSERFDTAQEMGERLTSGFTVATRDQVADWLQATAGDDLSKRAELVARMESAGASIAPPPSTERRRSEAVAVPPQRATPSEPRNGAGTLRLYRRVLLAATFAGVLTGSALALWGGPLRIPAWLGAPPVGDPLRAPEPTSPRPPSAFGETALPPSFMAGPGSAGTNRPAQAARPAGERLAPPASAGSARAIRPGTPSASADPACTSASRDERCTP